MIRFYIMPIVVVGTHRRAKYMYCSPTPPDFYEHAGIQAPWGLMDYGALINACIVAADVTQADHEILAAENDVASLPLDIDQLISDIAIPKVVSVLEALRIPADWINTTYTYRQVLRMVAGLFQFSQRHYGQWKEPLIDNVAALELRWNQIPLERRLRIQATADSLGYVYGDIENTWLVRRILKYLADQWGNTQFDFSVAKL